MVYDYLITLQKPDFKVINIISQLLYLLAIAAFLFFATTTAGFLNTYALSAVLLIIIFIVKKVRKTEGTLYYTSGLAIAAIGFGAGPYNNMLLALFYVVCLLAEREVKFNKEIGFTNDEVVLTTLIKKRYYWSEFNNILIKDGVITLDFNSNKVLQREIGGEVTPEVATEFNAYCQLRLKSIETAKIPEP